MNKYLCTMPTNVPVVQNVCKPASSTQSAFINNKVIRADMAIQHILPVSKFSYEKIRNQRSMRKGFKSTVVFSPDISSDSNKPVAGANVTPIIECPAPTNTFGKASI